MVLASPVHPVTEGHPLILRCLSHNKKIPDSGVDFYKDDSILQSQTTGEMTISSVSKSDEGFCHCKHPERGESLKSWVSVRGPMSNTVPVAVAVGLSLALLFIILLLILLWKHKSNKGKSPPVSLIISPSRTQHFTADSLSLTCEDQSDSTGWTVRRYKYIEELVTCSSVSGSTCNISSLSTSHTGVYWCQSESGGRSNPVNITVHYGAVILDSPVHPVTEGHPLTLHCLSHSKKIPDSGVDFYKDDSILQNQTTGEMTISSVSKSDEGFYHCKHPERGESLKSWVSVRLQSPGSNTVLVAVAVGLSLALLFIILLLILLWKHKSNKGKDRGIQQNSNQTPGQSQSGAEDSQSGNTPLQTGSEHIYATMDNADHDAGPSDVTYAELELKPQSQGKNK
ncbi:hypothetical protein KOW79_006692 [Hemibagrus wyckioides]|uniref:Ig-like domain-containing protein n=1 Tax=Hemibagrus wyckioides TaxID=337641 RepID=A0A9D3SP83_9TELE|nr:hypothetical protein KOW79_006692 [Hemibagrus wyckioides]